MKTNHRNPQEIVIKFIILCEVRRGRFVFWINAKKEKYLSGERRVQNKPLSKLLRDESQTSKKNPLFLFNFVQVLYVECHFHQRMHVKQEKKVF